MQHKKGYSAGLDAFKVTVSFLYLEQKWELWTLKLIRIRGYPCLTLLALHGYRPRSSRTNLESYSERLALR